MKSRNHVIWADETTLRRLKDEYEYLGRPCQIQGDKLVVFALPPKKRKDDKGAKKRGR
jgi:hypothetical protein